MARLFVLMGALSGVFSVSGLVINVSWNAGTDNQSCLTANASNPCMTLQYALKAESFLSASDTNLRIELLTDYNLQDEVAIHNGLRDETVLTITSGEKLVNLTCGEAGIFNISDRRNLAFVDLNFQECGPEFGAVLLLWRSINITFLRCTFRNNGRACINAFNSNVAIKDCAFRNNTSNALDVMEDERFVPGNVSASGGVAFVFRDVRELAVTITRSNFSFNKAVVNHSEYFIDHLFNVSHFTNGGGGILVVFSGSTEHCRVTIDGAGLFNNSASYGGGIYVAADNESKNNHFLLDHSKLVGNVGSQAGGAMGVTQWDNVSSTSIVIRNSNFEENWSRRGAGLNVYFNSFPKTLRDSELTLKNVHFIRNRGYSSTALRLGSSLPLGTPIPAANIFNCSFVGHVQTEKFAYTAPLTSQKVSIVFKGHNVFKENMDAGAAEFENTIIHVHDRLEFVENTGVQGGALTLRSSQIRLYPRSQVLFARNQAETMGGAVAVSNYMMYEVIKRFNPDCFLVYSLPHTPPSEWKVNITFVKNSAKLKGAAIYVSSLYACLWDELPPYANVSRALRWNSTKIAFDNNCLDAAEKRATCSEDEAIATDTASFKITSSDETSSTFKLAPGVKLRIPIQGLDQLQHDVYTVASLSRENLTSPLVLHKRMYVLVPSTNSSISLKYSMKYKDYQKLKDHSTSSYKFDVTDAYSTFDNQCSFKVQVQSCPPGFKFDKKKDECVCGDADGVLRCEEDRYVILKQGYWANVSNSGVLVTYYCPYMYCVCSVFSNSSSNSTPECKVDLSRPDMQCQYNRTGKLCGQCPVGHSVGLKWYECVENCRSGWILAVVIVIVAFLCILIIWLNPSISSELRGPLFFFQALPIIFRPNTTLWSEIVNVFANTFNFGGPLVLLKNRSCIQNGITNLYMVAIGYVMPLVTLGIFILLYMLSTKNLVRLKFSERSSLHSFWLLLLFVYHYLVETTFLLLNCPKVGGEHVFYYDGSIKCFSEEHAGMAALALVVLVFFIIPPPIIIVLLTNGSWRVDPQYTSTLTNGLRPQRQWWWAFELVRRILLVATYVFFSNWTTKQVATTVMCVFILTVHSNMQPYRKTRINLVESCYLFALSAMALFQIVDSVPLGVYISLLSVAALHTLVLFLYKSCRFFKKRFGRRGDNHDGEVGANVQNAGNHTNQDVLDAVYGNQNGTFDQSGDK